MVLLAVCTIVPMLFAYRRTVTDKGVEINHVALFTFGFLFYWILPIAVGQISSSFAGDGWSELFGTADFTTPYLLASLACYAAFVTGDLAATRTLKPVIRTARRVPEAALSICLAVAIPSAIYTAYAHRDLLFQEYGRDIPAERARGTVSSFVILFGIIAIFYLCDHTHKKVTQLLTSRFVLPFVAGCLFMLILASRIYVVSLVLIFAAFRSCFVRRIPLKSLIAGTAALAAMSGVVGAFRVGLALTDSAANLVLEPMMTSFSLIYFLRFDSIAWIHIPRYLLSDLINLVPTALFPGKADLIQFPFVYQPGGAIHSFVSFNYNFGLIGTALFMLVLPLGLQWIRMRGPLHLSRTTYSMLSGFLAFTFFRDPFSVSLVKGMLQFSILIPAAIFGFGRILEAAKSSPNAQKSN